MVVFSNTNIENLSGDLLGNLWYSRGHFTHAGSSGFGAQPANVLCACCAQMALPRSHCASIPKVSGLWPAILFAWVLQRRAAWCEAVKGTVRVQCCASSFGRRGGGPFPVIAAAWDLAFARVHAWRDCHVIMKSQNSLKLTHSSCRKRSILFLFWLRAVPWRAAAMHFFQHCLLHWSAPDTLPSVIHKCHRHEVDLRRHLSFFGILSAFHFGGSFLFMPQLVHFKCVCGLM